MEDEADNPHLGEVRSWHKGDIIGQGGFGKVYLCINNETGSLFATKEVVVRNAKPDKWEELENEINVMSNLRHPCIVRYLGCVRAQCIIYIFMEYIPGGSLSDILRRFKKLEEPVAQLYTLQMLQGLKYLHENNYVHRDFKSGNVLVDTDGRVKLSDFGTALKMQDVMQGEMQKEERTTCTPAFLAPERARSQLVGFQTDIWSLGCCVYEMLVGSSPGKGSNVFSTVYSMLQGPPAIPETLSKDSQDFLRLCFSDPSRRPTASQLLEHPFVCDRPRRHFTTTLQEPTFDSLSCFQHAVTVSEDITSVDYTYPEPTLHSPVVALQHEEMLCDTVPTPMTGKVESGWKPLLEALVNALWRTAGNDKETLTHYCASPSAADTLTSPFAGKGEAPHPSAPRSLVAVWFGLMVRITQSAGAARIARLLEIAAFAVAIFAFGFMASVIFIDEREEVEDFEGHAHNIGGRRLLSLASGLGELAGLGAACKSNLRPVVVAFWSLLAVSAVCFAGSAALGFLREAHAEKRGLDALRNLQRSAGQRTTESREDKSQFGEIVTFLRSRHNAAAPCRK